VAARLFAPYSHAVRGFPRILWTIRRRFSRLRVVFFILTICFFLFLQHYNPHFFQQLHFAISNVKFWANQRAALLDDDVSLPFPDKPSVGQQLLAGQQNLQDSVKAGFSENAQFHQVTHEGLSTASKGIEMTMRLATQQLESECLCCLVFVAFFLLSLTLQLSLCRVAAQLQQVPPSPGPGSPFTPPGAAEDYVKEVGKLQDIVNLLSDDVSFTIRARTLYLQETEAKPRLDALKQAMHESHVPADEIQTRAIKLQEDMGRLAALKQAMQDCKLPIKEDRESSLVACAC